MTPHFSKKEKNRSCRFWRVFCAFVMVVSAFAARAVEEQPNDVLAGVKVITPLKLQNTDKTGRLSAVKIEMAQSKISAKGMLDVGCSKRVTQTNQKTEGQYLERVLLGFGTAVDSFWARTVFENEDWTVHRFKGEEAVDGDLSLFEGTEYGASPVDLFLARGHKFAKDDSRLLSFFRNAQRYTIDYPLRFEMICRDYVRNTVTQRLERGAARSYVHVRSLPVPARYAGDKMLKAASIPRLKMSGSLVSPVAPKITRFDLEVPVIMEGPKNLRGACPLDARFKVRISGQEQGFFRLLIRSDRQILYTSEVQKFRGRDMDVGFSLMLDRVKDVPLYEQVLQKITIELQGKSKAQAKMKLYPVRRNSDPYFWQYSCITQ